MGTRNPVRGAMLAGGLYVSQWYVDFSLTVRQTATGTRRESPDVAFVRFTSDWEPPYGTRHLLDAPHRAGLARRPGVFRPSKGHSGPTGPGAGSGHPALEAPTDRRCRLPGPETRTADRP